MKNWVVIVLVLLAGLSLLYWRQGEVEKIRLRQEALDKKPLPPPPVTAKDLTRVFEVEDSGGATESPDEGESAPKPSGNKAKKIMALPYKLDDGIAVVQGDVAIGTPIDPNAAVSGFVEVPEIKLWVGKTIPYYIQADLPNPERVELALRMFQSTGFHFVLLTDQADALVFVPANGICKSYVGRKGGKQPIWLPASCGPTEIAHEILHALGFVHEQNRADRDDYIRVDLDNVEDEFRSNFEKLPSEFMKVSGLAPFDFESIMIYPVYLFSKGGHDTMESLVQDHPIHPSSTLSKSDLDRLNQL